LPQVHPLILLERYGAGKRHEHILKLIKKIPDNSQIVSLDSFRVFDGDCILTYKLFVVKMVSFKGKRKKVAVGTRFIEYRFTYAKEQLDWTLKSIRSFDF
jgi:hypothetical protein